MTTKDISGEIEVVFSRSRSHDGDPGGTLEEMLLDLGDLSGIKVAATGRKFRHLLNISTISEPEALELALVFSGIPQSGCRTVISAGGETFMAYQIDSEGSIVSVHTGNKCASGTGEFLLQQLGRMGLEVSDMSSMDMDCEAYPVSGRCSVFCKSDCTHALNKGVPVEAVVSGLATMMAGKCLEIISRLPRENVALIGGCSANIFMVRELERKIPNIVIPENAALMEALGASLWAHEHDTVEFTGVAGLIRKGASAFTSHSALENYLQYVEFHEGLRGQYRAGDEIIIGLDVGSTTTKGVVVRSADDEILASSYLRTNGDPVGAARKVYKDLAEQLPDGIKATALGVTGSGRAIAGLHAGTPAIINEIIAHATAAVYFDPEVDTIFEIGGQDAKYTWLKNSVPCDYAMNEACSAGTGSFLEESARETLGINVEDIADTAFKGQNPPNFSDQCAAFIGSDIKLAGQDGLPAADIVAGLVYSICMNYSARVKGNRPLGRKIFMQGGVCYNRAVPVAMAALTGRKIVVPPDPGLMGAFGVALEASKRIRAGLIPGGSFDLNELSVRNVEYKEPFICKGGGMNCDRRCRISRIKVEGRVLPFGGICNRYDNIAAGEQKKLGIDLVTWREKRVFRDYNPAEQGSGIVGMNRSLLMNSWFPLFNAFFRNLGLGVILPETPDVEGMERKGAPFCHPVELAHGGMGALLKLDPDYFFLPHFRHLPLKSGDRSCACVLVQGEPYYLRTAFPELEKRKIFSPVLNMQDGIENIRKAMLETARKMGFSKSAAAAAFDGALKVQEEFFKDIEAEGRRVLLDIESDPERKGIILFGRPYNAFSSWANKAIPAKFSTRGIDVIPCDMIPGAGGCPDSRNMYWAMGEIIMNAAKYCSENDNLFGTYITNFSCGPDSFLLGYFRDTMGRKPSLTLELDSHVADAGLETRIEAFLDIAAAYSGDRSDSPGGVKVFKAAYCRSETVSLNGKSVSVMGMVDSSGKWRSVNDEKVTMLIPSLGEISTDFLAASMARDNIRFKVLPHADAGVLRLGRNNSSCKECMPLQLTAGALLKYLEKRPEGEISMFLMPSAKGPCRFGQYSVFMNDLIIRKKIPDLAVFSPSSTNGYGGLSSSVMLGMWQGIVIGSVLEDIHAVIMTASGDREGDLKLFEKIKADLLEAVPHGWRELSKRLESAAAQFKKVKLEHPIEEYPVISLVGEIYVRHDPLARHGLLERLSGQGFIVHVAPVLEWMKYTDWLNRKGIEGRAGLGTMIRQGIKGYFERKVRTILARSGLVKYPAPDVNKVVGLGEKYVSRYLTGEAVLTVGAALHEILSPACGVIAIGPFGCMPSRVAEAVLSEKFNTAAVEGKAGDILEKDMPLPFLAIETDANPFPQLIEARLESFCLQARRLHERISARNH
jgi:predicted CoA-substrate-specific enzyme activase